MTDSRADRVEAIAQHARRLGGAERESYLLSACGDDPELRAAVEAAVAQIEQDARDPDFWRPPTLPDHEAQPTQLANGFRLGDFEIVRELGRGGMRATVYLARQISLGREVALKVLVRDRDTSQREIDRFHRSAKAAARLRHPGIVPIYTHGTEGEAHYFAMEYVAGHDLGRELALQHERTRRAQPAAEPLLLPPRTATEFTAAALRLCRDVARALQHAHEAQVVHRDIKPQNLMLDGQGNVRIVDFGLARDGTEPPPLQMTKSGMLIGTIAYMSPEQARAQRNAIDHRTDVYSLGTVLYELLTGSQPFRGDSEVEVLSAIVAHEPRPLRSLAPAVTSDLAAVCAMAMAKSLDERYRSAADFAEDLECILAIRPPRHARPLSVGQRLRRFVLRRQRPLAMAAGALGVALGAAWWATHSAAAAERDKLYEALRPVHDASDVVKLPFSALFAAKLACAGLRAQGLGVAEQHVLQTVEQRIADYWTNAFGLGARAVNEGLGDGRNDFPGALRIDRVVRGYAQLLDANRLFPEREAGPNLDPNSYLPKLTVRARDRSGAELRGRMSLRYLDLLTGVPGPQIEAGPLPAAAVRVEPGYVRVVVHLDDLGPREFTRTLWHADREVVIDCVADAGQNSTAGMALIQAAPARTTDGKMPYSGQPVEAFWLDETEVTLGDYRRFLRETSRPDPFASLAPPPADDLPAVFVSWEEALAYAESVGKRLPSAAEWEWAARGVEGRRLPGSEADGDARYGNGLAEPPAVRDTDRRAVFLRFAKPVRAHPQARTPEGLYEMLGNVREWTETLAAEQTERGWRPLADLRIEVGAYWHAKAQGADLRANGISGTGADFRDHARGFRCARSIPR